MLVVETLVCLTLWGPQPAAWLWIGSQVDYQTGSVTAGIAVDFAGMIASLMLTLVLLVRLDAIWKVVRRAGGIDQRAMNFAVSEIALPPVNGWTNPGSPWCFRISSIRLASSAAGCDGKVCE